MRPRGNRRREESAKLNGIRNASFVCAASEAFITSLSAIDVVLLNPPRKGWRAFPAKGNRAALSQEAHLHLLRSGDTRPRPRASPHIRIQNLPIQPYDMFPQTAHVECVAEALQ